MRNRNQIVLKPNFLKDFGYLPMSYRELNQKEIDAVINGSIVDLLKAGFGISYIDSIIEARKHLIL